MGIIILLILLPAPNFFKVWENRKARMLTSITNIDRARRSTAFIAPVTRCATNLFICTSLHMPCGQGLCLTHFIFSATAQSLTRSRCVRLDSWINEWMNAHVHVSVWTCMSQYTHGSSWLVIVLITWFRIPFVSYDKNFHGAQCSANTDL